MKNTQGYNRIDRYRDEVKTIPIKDIMQQRYGITMQQKGDAWISQSPMRPDSSPTSFSYSDRTNLWKDWVSGKGGDAISLVMVTENMSFPNAVMALHGQFFGPDRETASVELKPAPQRPAMAETPSNRTPLTDDELDRAYRIILNHCFLSEEDKTMLSSDRKLTDKDIREAEFKSMPEPTPQLRRIITDAFHKQGIDASKVPGIFYFKGDDRICWPKLQGLVIPIKNEDGKICALQIRKKEVKENENRYCWFSSSFAQNLDKFEHQGYTPGARAAILPGYKTTEQLFITEGYFKAQKLNAVFGAPVIGLSGVTSWRNSPIESVLKQYPNAKKIYICFDADAQRNPAVFEQMKRLSEHIHEKYVGMEARIMTWDGEKGKGIDDFFNRLSLVESISGLRGMTIGEFEHEFHPDKTKHENKEIDL